MKSFVVLTLALMFAQYCSAQDTAIPFLGSNGQLGQDNSNLTWDNAQDGKRFRVGPKSGYKDATFPYIMRNTQHTFGSINQAKKFPIEFATLMEDDDPTAAIAGMEVDVVARHTTGVKSDVTGFEADAYNDSTGTVNVLYPLAAYSEVNAGTVNSTVGLVVFSTSKASGAIVRNNIGIQVLDQEAGDTNNIAIKTGKGRVEFGDLVKLDPIRDPPCRAGEFFIWASAFTKKLRKCENGIASSM